MFPNPFDQRISMSYRRGLLVLLSALTTVPLSGCLVVGGSSRGGFFIFPGSLGLIVLIVIVGLILRRR